MELISFGQTVEVTVYENGQLFFSLFVPHSSEQRNCHLMLRISMVESTKCFLGILCYISFSLVSDFEDDFLYLYCECNL